jgi:hypothetical protein
MHNACIVEHDINTAPSVKVVYDGIDIGFLGNVANLELVRGEIL